METNNVSADALLKAWSTCNAVTIFLVKNLSDELWVEKIPGYPRKTIQMIGGHLHNTRCMWIKNTGKKAEVGVPEYVDRHRVSRQELISALGRSSSTILDLLGHLAEQKSVTGFPLDIVHFQNYLIAHEAHHRGQITMVAKQLGYDLSKDVTYGLWKWNKRQSEI